MTPSIKRRTLTKRRLHSETLETRHLLAGPYAPAAGQVGSSAIAHDDVSFVAWASRVEDYTVGSDVEIEFQTQANALGPAQGSSPGIVSLGRGGTLTLAFDAPIRNGLGADFAVFENSFSDTFLELGYVEVSSDGVNFFRFESDSQTPAAVGAFGSVDPTDINNLAGKYRAGFGTPFDLAELVGSSSLLDTTRVTHVRLVDVVGDGSALDASGDVIFDPFATVGSAGLDVDAVGVIHQSLSQTQVAGFEDVGASLAASSSFSGPASGGTTAPGQFGGTTTTGTFVSETLALNNSHNDQFGSWTGFAYSNVSDNTTAGFLNQYGSFAGGGASGSSTFALGFADVNGSSQLPTIRRASTDLRTLQSLAVTNSTYAALSMAQGDQFARKFGGDSGNDPDYLLLTIDGKDAAGTSVGTVEFYLADFRFADNSMDYIVDQWTEVDLTAIAGARSLVFDIDSSDVGAFGVNTPAYFALDDITFAKPVLPIDIADHSVSESDGDAATTVRISRADLDTTQPIVVSLASLDSTIASIPSTVTIAAGQSFVEFSIDVVNDELSGADRTITIEASADGFVTGSEQLTIVEDDALTLSVSLSAASVAEGGTFDLTVSRNSADLSTAQVVQLSDSQANLLDLPESVTIAIGQSTQAITVTAIEDQNDRADQAVTITATADGYVGGQSDLTVNDNDVAAVRIEYLGAGLSESMAPHTIGLEDVGATLSNESSYNGGALPEGFASGGVTFDTVAPDSFGGWAYSNTTDTTTPGFTNQYSAVTGEGAGQSDTYAVGVAFGVPRVMRSPTSNRFESIQITNTTYAALSMQMGDSFAKKFGGEDGSDEDFFVLTITGRDGQLQESGSIEFYLADYRSDDSASDYIVDQWTTVDLTGLPEQTVALEFSLSSSDVGQFGMNTPAYFAVDNLQLASNFAPAISVIRNTEDTSSPLTVTLSSDDHSELVLPTTATIPVGQSSIEVPLEVRDDSLVDGDQTVQLLVEATGFAGSGVALSVADDDAATLTLTALTSEVDEMGGAGRFLVHRNAGDISSELSLTLTADEGNRISFDADVVIPAGSRSIEVPFVAVDNDEMGSDVDVVVEATAAGFAGGQATVKVLNDDFPSAALTLSLDASTLSELDAPRTVAFEDIGAAIADASFYNGADLAGGFSSNGHSFNNSYNSDFGSWGGWSVSKTTDQTTVGFANQYSAVAGGGASQSESYAVASAFSGGTAPSITRDQTESGDTFVSMMVTNTTYAALSMRDGDSFAKQFGGETGDDPDFFLLSIEGVDTDGQSIGTVDFYLADYRFDDNSQDYIVDTWTSVDLSSLADAVELQFSLSSSDVGDFGMNTPAYFAVDQIVVSDTPSDVITATVTRNDRDLSEELVVQIESAHSSAARIPTAVTIPAGSASTTFEILAVDDAVFDGAQQSVISVSTGAHIGDQQSVTITDDETPVLTLSASDSELFESSESTSTQLLIHRNTANLAIPLVVDLSVVGDASSDAVQFPSQVTIPAGARTVVVNISASDNVLAQGDQTVQMSANADGFAAGAVTVSVIDDESTELIVEQTDDSTVVGAPGQSDSLLVRLAAMPASDVVIEVSSGSSKVRLSESQLRFSPETWNVPQTIDVTNRFDFEVEDAFATEIVLSVAAELSDSTFASLETVSVPVAVTDFQPAAVQVIERDSSIRLVDADTQIELDRATLRDGFALTGNDMAQTVTIDRLVQAGGFITVDLAGGDDTVIIRGDRFTSLDGGAGYDRLVIDTEIGHVDLVRLLANRAVGFEEIVVQGTASNEIALDSETILSLADDANSLLVRLASTQRLSVVGQAVALPPQVIDGQFTQSIQIGDAVLNVVSQTPHRNVLDVFDVDQSGQVTPADILAVIERISSGPSTLASLDSVEDFDGHYVDVSGDGLLTPADILEVINYLAEQASSTNPSSLPQGEGFSTDLIAKRQFENVDDVGSVQGSSTFSLSTFSLNAGLGDAQSADAMIVAGTGQTRSEVALEEEMNAEEIASVDLVFAELEMLSK
ncbi:DUF4465 domain-containing protein [Planctomycetes bacterium K23_9]|uniref:Dockerin type I repeat protein n=1 Tax=Stieleria marina TaxID=1930275 RepID=A0A517NPA8_9BACT|nr:hypothetical protein K239x_09080 [Planctomycetes bacterium K23_9]